MTLASTINHAISQLQGLQEIAEDVDKLRSESTAARSKIADLEDEAKSLEQNKARLLKEVTELKQQVEVLRGEKLAERKARQDIVEKANETLKDLHEQIATKQGQRDEISAAISQLKGKFG